MIGSHSRFVSLCLLAVFASISLAAEPDAPRMPEADGIRIAEAFRLADALGNRVWPDWDKAPFAVLLVTREHEFLLRHPKPSDDFAALGEDKLLKQAVSYRKRKFSPELLATFPAVGGVPTIVIGQAENTTAKTSTPWVITLLHEHFHQLQNSQPRYYADVDALGLARGDQTGMWMLNYPFPYTTATVAEQFSVMCQALLAALQARKDIAFPAKLASYVEARGKFLALLSAEEQKYFAFQKWQEGIARYTEYHLAKLAAASYKPSPEFQNLKDFMSYSDHATALAVGIEKELSALKLDRAKRTAFYAVGAAEGLLLDRVNPDWRKQYFTHKFTLDEYFQPAK